MLIASWGMHERVVFRSQLEAVGVRLIISRISLSLVRTRVNRIDLKDRNRDQRWSMIFSYRHSNERNRCLLLISIKMRRCFLPDNVIFIRDNMHVSVSRLHP